MVNTNRFRDTTLQDITINTKSEIGNISSLIFSSLRDANHSIRLINHANFTNIKLTTTTPRIPANERVA